MISSNGSKPGGDPTKYAAMIKDAMPPEEALALLRQDEQQDSSPSNPATHPTLQEELRDWAARVEPLADLDRRLARNEMCGVLAERGVSTPARLVDAALKEAVGDQRPVYDGPGLFLSDPEPWPEAVEGEALLDELQETLERHMALPQGAARRSRCGS